MIDDEDAISLRSYNMETNNNKTEIKDFVENIDIEKNKNRLNDDTLSINQIYNKNLERLRFLNKLEDNIYNFSTKEYDNIAGNIDNYDNKRDFNYQFKKSYNFDDFMSKLNNL